MRNGNPSSVSSSAFSNVISRTNGVHLSDAHTLTSSMLKLIQCCASRWSFRINQFQRLPFQITREGLIIFVRAGFVRSKGHNRLVRRMHRSRRLKLKTNRSKLATFWSKLATFWTHLSKSSQENTIILEIGSHPPKY